MPPSPPDPDHVARAYELHLEYGNLNRVREQLAKEGISVARSTVGLWVKQGQAAEAHIELMNREEERQRANQRLNVYTGIALDAYKMGRSDPVEIIKALLAIEDRRAKMLGLDAPVRVHATVGEDQSRQAVDPATVAAIRAARERSAREEHALLAEAVPQIAAPTKNGNAPHDYGQAS